MNQRELAYFKDQLNKEYREFSKEIHNFLEGGMRDSIGRVTGELSSYDNHPADLGSEVFEKEKDIALLENARISLKQVENALRAVDEGRYGLCDSCNEQINYERLKAIPYTSHCYDCQKKIEDEDKKAGTNAQRPVEEDVLKEPFGRTFMDNDPKESIIFDGEDAWQDVERYGTSSTPQDIPRTKGYDDLWQDSDENIGFVEEIEKLKSDPNH